MRVYDSSSSRCFEKFSHGISVVRLAQLCSELNILQTFEASCGVRSSIVQGKGRRAIHFLHSYCRSKEHTASTCPTEPNHHIQPKIKSLLPWGRRLVERLTGIEPAYQAWEACALPLSYSRIFFSVSRLLAGGEMCCGCLCAGVGVEM